MNLTLHRVNAADLQVGMSLWWDGDTHQVSQITRTDKGYRVVAGNRIVLLGRWALVQVKGDA